MMTIASSNEGVRSRNGKDQDPNRHIARHRLTPALSTTTIRRSNTTPSSPQLQQSVKQNGPIESNSSRLSAATLSTSSLPTFRALGDHAQDVIVMPSPRKSVEPSNTSRFLLPIRREVSPRRRTPSCRMPKVLFDPPRTSSTSSTNQIESTTKTKSPSKLTKSASTSNLQAITTPNQHDLSRPRSFVITLPRPLTPRRASIGQQTSESTSTSAKVSSPIRTSSIKVGGGKEGGVNGKSKTSPMASHRLERSSSLKKMKRRSSKQRSSKLRAEIDPECAFCSGSVEKNPTGLPEPMMSCWTCGSSGHPSCMRWSKNSKKMEKAQGYEWNCMECKECEVCQTAGRDADIMFCDQCDRGWHLSCLELIKLPRGELPLPIAPRFDC